MSEPMNELEPTIEHQGMPVLCLVFVLVVVVVCSLVVVQYENQHLHQKQKHNLADFHQMLHVMKECGISPGSEYSLAATDGAVGPNGCVECWASAKLRCWVSCVAPNACITCVFLELFFLCV